MSIAATEHDLGLDTHINDVLGVLEHEDLHEVILVGHSYAGMVISGAGNTRKDGEAVLSAATQPSAGIQFRRK